MSATTTMTTLLESAPLQGQAVQAPPPPISELLPIILRFLTTVWSISTSAISILFQFSKSITRGAFWPFAPVIPIATYILAPVFIFLSLTLDVFILTPYKSLLYILHALYPVYVFCGVAFIISVIIGFGGRAVIALMKTALLEYQEREGEHSVQIPGASDRKRSMNRRKRVKIEQ